METGQQQGGRGQGGQPRSRRSWVGLSLAIALLVVGCTPSKRTQCNQLVKAVKAMQPVGTKLQAERGKFMKNEKAARATNRFDAVKQVASTAATEYDRLIQELDPLIQDLRSVTLQDPTLLDLQTRYVQNFQVIRTSLATTKTALATVSTLEPNTTGLNNLRSSVQQFESADRQMRDAIRTDQQLVTTLNQYCETKP